MITFILDSPISNPNKVNAEAAPSLDSEEEDVVHIDDIKLWQIGSSKLKNVKGIVTALCTL